MSLKRADATRHKWPNGSSRHAEVGGKTRRSPDLSNGGAEPLPGVMGKAQGASCSMAVPQVAKTWVQWRA